MVLVIVVNQCETSVTVALIQSNRCRVVDAHLQPQVGAVMFKGAGLDAFQQLFAKTIATEIPLWTQVAKDNNIKAQ